MGQRHKTTVRGSCCHRSPGHSCRRHGASPTRGPTGPAYSLLAGASERWTSRTAQGRTPAVGAPRCSRGESRATAGEDRGSEHAAGDASLPDRASAPTRPGFPRHLSLHCANVTFLLVPSHVFSCVRIRSPYWRLPRPRPETPSKVLLFPPHALSSPQAAQLAPLRAHAGREEVVGTGRGAPD